MKKLFLCLPLILIVGCSLFTTPKTPLESTPGNHITTAIGTNGFSFDMLDQQNSTYSNLSATINSNGTSTFQATGVTHTMDPGVITMSGKAYLDVLNAQYAAQQAVLAQVIQFAGTAAATGGVAAKAPTQPTQVPVENVFAMLLNTITNQEAIIRAQAQMISTNKP